MPEGSVVVRSLPYPVLEPGNLSYPRGEYRVEPSPRQDGHSAELRHVVVNAPFVEAMLREGRAVYMLVVSQNSVLGDSVVPAPRGRNSPSSPWTVSSG